MIQQITLREINQHFADYIKWVENGDSLVLTRRGKPIARITPILDSEALTKEHVQAKEKLLALMERGFSLKNERYSRDDLYE